MIFLKINFIIIIPCSLGLPSGLLPSSFLPKFCIYICSLPCMLHAIPISSSSFSNKYCDYTFINMSTITSKENAGILFHSQGHEEKNKDKIT
jgi:hypothetical protein